VDKIEHAKRMTDSISELSSDDRNQLRPAALSLQVATVRALIGISEQLDKMLKKLGEET